VIPAIAPAMYDITEPMVAPSTPSPRTTSRGPTTVLTMAWQTRVKLLRFILSYPTKTALAAEMMAPASMARELMAMNSDIVDWALGMVENSPLRITARELDKTKHRADRAMPLIISKTTPETIMSWISAFLSEALRLAICLVMAEFTPQSLKKLIMDMGMRAAPYSAYSADDARSLPRIIIPTAIIMVEDATPMSIWKLPVAEDLPMFIALSMVVTCAALLLVRLGCLNADWCSLVRTLARGWAKQLTIWQLGKRITDGETLWGGWFWCCGLEEAIWLLPLALPW